MPNSLHRRRRVAKRRRVWRMPDSFVDWTGMATRARREDADDLVAGVLVVAAVAELADEFVPHAPEEPVDGLEIEDEVDAEPEAIDSDETDGLDSPPRPSSED